jgi:thioredoxin-like negative regulator of GroEL
LNVPVPDIASDVTPTSLSAAQVKAHMARLKAISEPNSPLIEQWCSETLAVAPGDERAMLTLTDYYLHNRNFEKLRPLLQRLASDESLSAVGHREIAAAMTMLAKLRTDGVPGLESDAATALRADARRQLHLAIAKNATDPIAAYQLGWLLVSQGDVAAVRETLPTIETIFYTYPKSAALATLLVRMHAIGGSPEDEFKFAVVQSRLVDNEVERQAALRRIEKLRGQLKVK